MRTLRVVLVTLFIVIPFMVFFWLLNNEFLFSGQWTSRFDFSSPSRLIKPLTTNAQEKQSGDAFAVFDKLPANFLINKSGIFDTLGVEAWFKAQRPVVKVSVVAQKDPWQIKTKTIYNKFLDDLPWSKTEKKNAAGDAVLTLWQKEKKFVSPDEFLQAVPSPGKVLTVNYDWQSDLVLPNYQPRAALYNYNLSLRGPQTIYFYLGREDLNWHFYFQDVNRHDGADDVDIRVTNAQGEVVLTEKMADDGEVWSSGRMSPLRELTLRQSLPPGVYKMQISAPDDIFIRRFQTSQQKFVFQYVVYLGDVSANSLAGYPVVLYGQTKNLTLRTPHETGEQIVTIDGKRVDVAQVDENYKAKTSNEFTRVVVSQPDLKVDFDGFFALSPDAFFLPKPLGFEQASDAEQFKTDYILAADYEPAMIGEWILSKADFTLDNVNQKDGLEIFLDTSGSEAPDRLALTELKVKLGRSPMSIKTFLSKMIVRTKSYFKR